MKKKKILAIVGPTASGKSGIGIKLALKFNGEIISADSRQIYKYANIGTGKVMNSEMHGIKHYCISLIDPIKKYSAWDFKQCAEKAINNITDINKLPIIVGGTGFYVSTIINNLTFPNVVPDNKLRIGLGKKSSEQLVSILREIDKKWAANIDISNKQRLIRAIEIASKGEQQKKEKVQEKKKYFFLTLGIGGTREEIRSRIRSAIEDRLRRGVIGEIKKLRSIRKLPWNVICDLGLDYKYLSEYIRGKINKEEAITKLEIEIWRYSKRQLTWLSKQKGINWIDSYAEAEKLVTKFLK